MFKILDKKKLSEQVTYMKLEAPHVTENALPGQFLVIKIDEEGERIPLTIVDKNKSEGAVTIIFQEVGKTTKQLASLECGTDVMDVIGPLGRPAHMENLGKVVCVGGGIGTAEIYPVARSFKNTGNEVIAVVGSRNKDLLILIDEMKAVSDRLYITTDDGSAGRKGFVTDVLEDLLKKENVNLVYSVGPVMMMRTVAQVTKIYNVKTIVSLNANMVDATGMCGTCRVNVGGVTKFTCVDGPDFDAHQVDWVEFINRDRRFKDKEEESLKFHEKTKCPRKG